jgi:hypothetical protein
MIAPEMKLSERDIDRALLSSRTHYDRAECCDEWLDTEQLAEELARATVAAQAAHASLRIVARLVCGTVVLAMAALASYLNWGLAP